jgi:hypothetical protein
MLKALPQTAAATGQLAPYIPLSSPGTRIAHAEHFAYEPDHIHGYMTYKKYRTNWKGAPLQVAIAVCLGIILALASPHLKISNPIAVVCFLVLAYCVLDGFAGTYVIVTDAGVYRVDSFLWRRGLEFEDIDGCYYHPTWIIGTRARSLSIVRSAGTNRKTVQLATNHFYSLKDIASIIADIKGKQPDVKLDEPAEALLERFAHN